MPTTLPYLTEADVPPLRGDPSKPDQDAGFGTLTTSKGALPLVALGVDARISGLIAGLTVRQVFINSHNEPLEAIYICPLPDRAAVTSFHLEVAGRVVEGELQERNKARREYDRAIEAGHRAAIAEEERPGVFTMRVGNLPPGERAEVRLTLVGPLPCSDGDVTFRFPLVVAPRYIPGTALAGPAIGSGVQADTDAVPDASRISPPVLLPGFPNPVRLDLAVEVAESSLAPHDFRSSLHTVVEEESATGRRFRVLPGERLDRDFILRWRLGADRIHTSLTVQPDAEGAEEGTFLLTVMPPAEKGRQKPRDVVFVLDRSGSMGGWKMVAARRAVARMVETLTDRDRFTVSAFDDRIETPPDFDGTALVPAGDRQRFRAAEFLAGIEARGGTEMEAPLEQAVEELTRGAQSADIDRILVLITDGQVGNEDRILRKLGSRVAGVRIFTLGIDRAVNAAFLRRLADLGGGASEVVESEARLDEVMGQIHRHIGAAMLTGLTITPAGLEVISSSLVPNRLPDLFAGAPLTISGRYRGSGVGAIRLRARDSEGESWSTEVGAWKDAATPLGKVWARGRVRDLEDQYVIERGDKSKLEHEIVETSLRFGVLSRFTAFIAVDRSAVVNPGGVVKQVTQAVEQPAGWAGHVDACLSAMSAPPNAPNAAASYRSGGAGAGGIRPGKSASPPAPARPATPSQPLHGGARKIMNLSPELLPPAASPADESAAVPLDAEEGRTFGYRGGREGVPGRAERHKERNEQQAKRKVRREIEEAKGGFDEETPRQRSGQASILQRLLGLFGLGKQAKSAKAPELDRHSFRARVAALLQRLEAQSSDTQARWGVLQSTAAELEAMFRDLVAAGDRHESVERLGKQLVALQPLLSAVSPAANAIDQTHAEIVTALRDWLALVDAAGGRSEGFWK